jgi:plasmid stabilization system protein ParE
MMAYTLLVTDEAEDDMQDAADWYRLADSGLEAEFIRTIEACLESIKRNPNQYPTVYKDVHRALLRKFPYGIFYFVFDATIIVQSCFHTSRNPNAWQNRV